MPGRETHLKQQQQIMSGVARDSGQVGMFGPADSGSRIIVTKTDHIISSSMDGVVSLDYSIITLEDRVETLNFLFFSFLFFLSSFFFFSLSLSGSERDGLPRRPLEQTPIMDCHGVSITESFHIGLAVIIQARSLHIYHKHRNKERLPPGRR